MIFVIFSRNVSVAVRLCSVVTTYVMPPIFRSTVHAEYCFSVTLECMGTVSRASVELSGAAKAKFTVTEKLHYSLSGVSTLRVKKQGNPKVGGEASRGSKVEWHT